MNEEINNGVNDSEEVNFEDSELGKTELKDDFEESEVEKKTSEEKPASEAAIPYHRFKEVNQRKKELEEEIESIRQNANKENRVLSPEEQKEVNAKKYLENLVQQQIEQREKIKQEQLTREEKIFNEQVSEVLEFNPSVKKTDFMNFLEKEADDYGIKSVEGAMNLFKRLNSVKEEIRENTKKEIKSRPILPSNEGGVTKEPVDVSKKSWGQLGKEALEKFSS